MPIKFSEFTDSVFPNSTDHIVGYNDAGENIKISKADLISALGINNKNVSLFGNLNGGTITVGTFYGCPGTATLSGLESNRKILVSKGTIIGMYFQTTAVMTGVFTATVRKNGVDTAMTMTIATGSAAATYSVLTGSFDVADGDAISIKFTQATANATIVFGFSLIERI